jgi:hypothetical protein
VAIPFVVVVGFDGDKIAFERIYWDQASMLAQLGLLDKACRFGNAERVHCVILRSDIWLSLTGLFGYSTEGSWCSPDYGQ